MRALSCLLVVLLITGAVLQLGCSSSTTPSELTPMPELVDRSGSVSGFPATDLTIHNSLGDWPVSTDGTFTLSVPASGGCQLAIVQTSDEYPVLLGWLGESRQTVGYRSTAEVLAYFALGGSTTIAITTVRRSATSDRRIEISDKNCEYRLDDYITFQWHRDARHR